MCSKFTYASSPVHPFVDVNVCDRVMQLSRDELCRHPNPKLKIGVIEDDTQYTLKYYLDILAGIKRSLEEGRQHVIIFGAPDPGYALLAQMINQLNISCQARAHVQHGRVRRRRRQHGAGRSSGRVPVLDVARSVQRIKPELAIPRDHVHFPSTANIDHYTRMIEDLGGADVCYGGCGWNGHIAFFEPHVGAGIRRRYGRLHASRARIVALHPITIAQNSLFCDAGASGAWHRVPPKAATIGPKDLVNSKLNTCYHWFAYGDVSWQRFITRLILHGPVTPKVPGSIYQVIGADVWLSGRVAADISTSAVAERRVAFADIRD